MTKKCYRISEYIEMNRIPFIVQGVNVCLELPSCLQPGVVFASILVYKTVS